MNEKMANQRNFTQELKQRYAIECVKQVLCKRKPKQVIGNATPQKLLESLQKALNNTRSQLNCCRMPLFRAFPFPISRCQKVSFSMKFTSTDVKEIEAVVYKVKKEIDKFQILIVQFVEINEKHLTKNEYGLPDRAGDGRVVLKGQAIEEIKIPGMGLQGEIRISIEKMPFLGHDKIIDSIGSSSIRMIPKEFLVKPSSLSRMHSSRGPIEALADCTEDDNDVDDAEEGEEKDEDESLNERSLTKIDTDLERLRDEIDSSSDILDEVKNEVFGLRDAVNNMLLTGQVAKKIAKAQRMTAKLKEVSKMAARMMATLKFNQCQKNLQKLNEEKFSAELRITRTSTDSVLLSWTPSKDLLDNKIVAFLIFVNDEVYHKVRNPLRRQAVLVNIEPESEFTLYAEMADGERVMVATTRNSVDREELFVSLPSIVKT